MYVCTISTPFNEYFKHFQYFFLYLYKFAKLLKQIPWRTGSLCGLSIYIIDFLRVSFASEYMWSLLIDGGTLYNKDWSLSADVSNNYWCFYAIYSKDLLCVGNYAEIFLSFKVLSVKRLIAIHMFPDISINLLFSKLLSSVFRMFWAIFRQECNFDYSYIKKINTK